MRIASIDCGSNSFHLLICNVLDHDQLNILEDEKSLLYLGAEVASTGNISQSTLLRARRVMRHYKKLIEHHDVQTIRCVATSAIRSANNGDEIVSALSKTLGHQVKVISGKEEAELIFRGISALSTLPESRILAIDMGGGSLEIMAGQRYGLEHAQSFPLGASRLARELKVSDPLTADDIKSIEDKCDVYFQEFRNEYPKDLFSNIIASSGTFTALINMARAQADGTTPTNSTASSASKAEVIDIVENLITLEPNKRRKLLEYDKNRDEFISTSAVIARKVMSLASDNAEWTISPYALREGIALSLADEENNDKLPSSKAETSRATVNLLTQKIDLLTPNMEISQHSNHVMELAWQIFDSLKSLHKLRDRERTILGYAARLHNIGETINRHKYDQHGAYILSNIALAGFTPDEATLLRGIVRWHRLKDPKKSDKFVGPIGNEELEKATWLSSILRIADGADSSMRQLVKSFNISVKPDAIYIELVSNSDIELEIYSARKKRLLLESISQRDVIIVQGREQQMQV